MKVKIFALIVLIIVPICLTTCSPPPQRQFYLLNYVPQPPQNRIMRAPYAAVIRLRDFSIEEAYNRQQIVFRTSPFKLQYYNFKSWAVRPARMVTDLFFKHLNSAHLVTGVTRRFDEGRRPDYEITGFIEAIQEFDSEDILYAHMAMRVNMTRLSDGTTVYSRHFDLRRRVYRKETEFVVRELSQIIEYIFTAVIEDIDHKLAEEFRILEGAMLDAPEFLSVETPVFEEEGHHDQSFIADDASTVDETVGELR